MALVALGVTGGIGAYKAVEIARGLQKRGHDVVALMTRSARRFVTPLTFEAITRRRVITSQWAPGMNADIEHIALTTEVDLLVVAPATANIIAKFAHGIADDFLTSFYLALRKPILLAPAMNTNMFEHPTVVANLATLTGRGVQIVDPGSGYLACGWIGKGRLAEPEDVVEAVQAVLSRRAASPRGAAVQAGAVLQGAVVQGVALHSAASEDVASHGTALRGLRVLVSAGPTYEDLDPVRYIGNRSSGKMGLAVAAEAVARGADVTVVLGPSAQPPPAGVKVVPVRSAAQMHAAILAHGAADADVIVMAAAVADYTAVSGPAPQKIAKSAGSETLTITLAKTPDILADLARARGTSGRPLLIGFAAETNDVIAKARAKLTAKQVDLIVANDVSRADAGFEVDTNAATLVAADGLEELPLQSKRALAGRILDRVSALLQAAPAR